MKRREAEAAVARGRSWDRPVVEDSTFGFATGRIRILEGNLLGHDDLMRLASDTTSSNWNNQLNSAGYPQASSLRERLTLMSQANDRFLIEVAGQTPLARALLLEYDYHHVKVMLKTWLLATREAGFETQDLKGLLLTHRHLMVPESPTDIDQLATWLAAKLAQQTPTVTLGEDLEAQLNKVLENLPQDAAIASVDRRLDRAYYDHLLALIQTPEAKGIKDLMADDIAIRADGANIQSLYRIRKAHGSPEDLQLEWMPGGEIPFKVMQDHFYESEAEIAEAIRDTHALVAELAVDTGIQSSEAWGDFGKHRDNLRLRLAQKSMRTPFGAEVPYAYWLGRREEIKNLRLLLAAEDRGMPVDDRAQLLRNDYRSRA